MSEAKKVVLISRSGYSTSHDDILRSLIQRKVHLFCAVGKDCKLWEEVMDELVVGPTGEYEWRMNTTSHPDESTEDVIEFAEQFHIEDSHDDDVEVIEI